MTLTEFLLERIGEDEAGAQYDYFVAEGRAPQYFEGWIIFPEGGTLAATPEAFERLMRERYEFHRVVTHARVLAECEAKRRIMEIAAPLYGVTLHGQAMDALLLKALALPYADHPDYREEWRP